MRVVYDFLFKYFLEIYFSIIYETMYLVEFRFSLR